MCTVLPIVKKNIYETIYTNHINNLINIKSGNIM